ncbi:hypothetical protein YC2023_016619 [Brassica napus]
MGHIFTKVNFHVGCIRKLTDTCLYIIGLTDYNMVLIRNSDRSWIRFFCPKERPYVVSLKLLFECRLLDGFALIILPKIPNHSRE